MSTRAYPTSRKLIDLLGDVAIISMTYIVLALLLVNRQVLVMHIVLYSGMLPLAVVLSIGLFIIYGLYTLQYMTKFASKIQMKVLRYGITV